MYNLVAQRRNALSDIVNTTSCLPLVGILRKAGFVAKV